MRKTTLPTSGRFNRFLLFFITLSFWTAKAQISFDESDLDLNGQFTPVYGYTAMKFGPDNRLYVADQVGEIHALDIERSATGTYKVVSAELLNGVLTMQDHNDNGTAFEAGNGYRQVTGLTVAGTATNPIVYVSSSDFRHGGGAQGGVGDTNLDTNSGVITRIEWNGTSWETVDLVRGLPRSEENHSTNGLEHIVVGGNEYLIVAQGGHANGGAPSVSFAYQCEYALSAAVLSLDLTALEALPDKDDNGRKYKYDLPTVDDPTRANVNGITDPDDPSYNGIDVNDPFGGNDGLNQAYTVAGGPVQILAPGFRNAYDLVVTESGMLYVTDNGANPNWGGLPDQEGGGNVTNNYVSGEIGDSQQNPTSDGEYVNNEDNLQLITTNISDYYQNSFGNYYGGHPTPIRANPLGAGLYTHNGTTGVFRTQVYDPNGSTPNSTTDPNQALPANWFSMFTSSNAIEGDWRGPGATNPDGPDNPTVTIWSNNTNGIAEYTASNFDGAMQGDLLGTKNGGIIHRVELNTDGSLNTLHENWSTGLGSGYLLAIDCQGDGAPFPGTIWVGGLSKKLVVLEPQDFINCIEVTDPAFDPSADYDADGYTNQDELDNGTDYCNGGSQPSDFDEAAGAPYVSDLNDTDDDNDGIDDKDDPLQLGNPTDSGSDAFAIPVSNDFFNFQHGLGGIYGLGFTGLMNNGDANPNWLNWLDDVDAGPNPNDVMGGNNGWVTLHMTSGTANGTANTQEKGFQYGVQVDNTIQRVTVIGSMFNFTGGTQLYGNTSAVGGEIGLFIGDGTQSNFMKFVVNTDGLSAVQELSDIPDTSSALSQTIPTNQRPGSELLLYFVITPSTGVVSFEYAIDGGTRQTLGTITASGSILQAIQQASSDLVVGLIGTSNTSGVELTGNWDYLYVLDSKPIVVEEIPNVLSFVNGPQKTIDLTQHFNDDQGVGNLTFTVQNTNTAVTANIQGTDLVLTFPATEETASITVRATDSDNEFIEDTFEVIVTEDPIVLYRVNSGGPEIAAIDGEMAWEQDDAQNNSTYLSNAGNNAVASFGVNAYDASVDQTTTPVSIFQTERYDSQNDSDILTYSFPITENGNYEVRIYFGNGWSGTSEAGQRIFDVTIEGTLYPLLSNIDLSDEYGHKVGAMASHIIKVEDGALDISFLHDVIENPLVNGIEILDVPEDELPIYVGEIEDLLSFVGDEMNGQLGVHAVGGEGNLNFSIAGQPQGISIEPTNGYILGTLDQTTLAGSPYTVTVTVDDSDAGSADATSIQFVWTIEERMVWRINASGELVAPTDNDVTWENNEVNGAQTGSYYYVNTGFKTDGDLQFVKKDASVPAYIDEVTFSKIFEQDRYDPETGAEMQYDIPLRNGDYMVHLYLGNSYNPTSGVGSRIFDILLEGTVVKNDLDIIDEFGHQVAGMLAFPVTVSDGELNIGFNHEVENPIVSAIEVYFNDTNHASLSFADITDQTNDIFDTSSFSITGVAGGNPGEAYEYYMTGQPEGIDINQTTGAISGTIMANSIAGGPEGNGIHSVTVTIKKKGSVPVSKSFVWTINTSYLWTNKNEDEGYTARHENSFVQAGNKFYLMGGRESAKTIDVYDYTNDSWTSLTDSAPKEFNHFQAVEYQGLIWIIGAFNNNSYPNETPQENIWMFNPATEKWIMGPEIPENRRRGSTGVAVYNNKFYIVGGNTDGHDGGYVAWFDEFDPATGQWTTLTDAPRARDHFAAAVIDNKLYAVGGRLSGGTEGVFKPTISEVDVYDFTSGTWSTLPSNLDLPTPRGGCSVVNFNDNLVVIGGEVENQDVYGSVTNDALKITEAFNPGSQSWERWADMHHDRHGTQAIVSGPGVHIAAGSPNKGGGNQKNMEVLGVDAPEGDPSVASVLNAPEIVVVADGTSESFDITVATGNVGIYVDNMELNGQNASDYSVDSGTLSQSTLAPGATHSITVSLDGTGADRTAALVLTLNNDETVTIILTNNPNLEFEVTNPGNQFNYEGDSVSLPIVATSTGSLEYSATGLPPTLTINPSTGVISGVIDDGSNNNAQSFLESNGLLIVEAETDFTDTSGGWDLLNESGVDFLEASSNHFNTITGETVTYSFQITNTGVYRFHMKSDITGTNPTEHNDTWFKIDNTSDVHFFCADNVLTSTSEFLDILNGTSTKNVYYPKGNSQGRPDFGSEGEGVGGFFKVYRSVAAGLAWDTYTIDNHGYTVYAYFPNAGTYTISMSERSAGHKMDRFALTHIDMVGTGVPTGTLNGAESSQAGNGPGAADNSPYNVTVSVVENGTTTESVSFEWIIGNVGDLIAVPESDVVSGEAPLTVNFTGSNSLDDQGVTSYSWNFDDNGAMSSMADPSYTFNSPGTYTVELTVEDADSNTSTNSIEIEVVAPPNNAPEVTNPGNQSGNEGDSVSLQITATDSDGDTLTYSAVGLPGGLSIDASSGLITGTLATGAADNSPYTVTVTVTDDGDPQGSGSETFEWTVGVPASNNAPEVTNPGNQSGNEGDSVSLQITATDSDGDTLTYSAVDLPGGLSIDASSGLITGTLATGAADNSPYTVTVTVTDDGDPQGSDSATFEWTVGVPASNNAPVVTNPGNQSGNEGDSVSLQITATDSDGDTLTYSAVGLPGGLSIDASSGLITGTLATGAADNSPYTVTVTVTDDGDPQGSGSETFEWTVGVPASNNAPVVTNPGNQSGNEGDSVSLQITATDSDGDTLTYSAVGLPGGLSIDASSGLITGTLATGAADNSPYTVTVTVTDDGDPQGSGSETFEWTVGTTTVENMPPKAVISANPTTGEAPLVVNFTGEDSTDDTGIVSYKWSFGDGSAESSVMNPSYTFNTAGDYTVTLTVTDGEGLTDSATIEIKVSQIIIGKPRVVLVTNPTSGTAEVMMENMPEDVSVTGAHLHDSSGRLIEVFPLEVILAGENMYHIPVESLRDELYYITMVLSDDEDPVTIKLLVKN